MKIGVYTIALNESKFAERWVRSAKDADYIFVADAGSEDNTIEILERNDVKVSTISINPWRFDDARNAALSMLPSNLDVIVSLDLDEILLPGWREKIEKSWNNCTRLRYKYIWSWYNDRPNHTFFSDKIAGRFTHRWKHPVHEVLVPTIPETINTCDDILIEHHPDNDKSRGQYLGLLEKAVQEDSTDDRNAYYLGREYYFRQQYLNAIKQLKRHLELPKAVWSAERSSSMRYIAKSYEGLNDIREADYWYSVAVFEDLSSKEALIDAAKFSLKNNNFHRVLDYCEKAFRLNENPGHYLNERYAHAEGPYDLAGVANYHLGNVDLAKKFAEKAIELNPYDDRLKKNLVQMV